MAKTRHVNTRFWDDEFIANLGPAGKLLFLYFLTNSLTDLCGAYEISMRRIVFDTGLDEGQITELMAAFEAADKILYRDGWVMIRNFAKHQQGNSPNVRKGAERSLSCCPDWVKQTLSKGYDTASKENALLPIPRPIPRPRLKTLVPADAGTESPEPAPKTAVEKTLPDHKVLMEHHGQRIGKILDGAAQGAAVKKLLSNYPREDCLKCYDHLVSQLKSKGGWRSTKVSWLTVISEIGEWKSSQRPIPVYNLLDFDLPTMRHGGEIDDMPSSRPH